MDRRCLCPVLFASSSEDQINKQHLIYRTHTIKHLMCSLTMLNDAQENGWLYETKAKAPLSFCIILITLRKSCVKNNDSVTHITFY